MQFRKLQADRIFNGFHWLSQGQVLIVDENGEVQDIVSKEEAGNGIEQLKGIIVPGFINCHCHLELSHLKNTVPTNTGLVNFLMAVIKKRSAPLEKIFHSISAAEKEMFANGISAVADISNTDHAFQTKKESRVLWHNLIEVINLHDENLEKHWAHFNTILELYKKQTIHSTTSLTPHAPYSVSAATLKALNNATTNCIISIHNQESNEENDLFKNGSGDFLKLFAALGESGSPFEISGKTSLQTWLPYFTNGQTILLVHNTFISEEDILFASKHEEKYGLKLVYCLCPNANLYIENKLPPVDLLIKHNCKIVLGTDSYSSNWQLNIASEIKTLMHHFPHLQLETILQCATSNGAEALQFSSLLGSFKKGSKPGVVLLESDPVNKNSITGMAQRII
jgi:cytosine/adenosine deaminase-related metal-dependent hydrolase